MAAMRRWSGAEWQLSSNRGGAVQQVLLECSHLAERRATGGHVMECHLAERRATVRPCVAAKLLLLVLCSRCNAVLLSGTGFLEVTSDVVSWPAHAVQLVAAQSRCRALHKLPIEVNA